ncbi:MAG: cytochrome b561 domain-containing protein [Rhodospirillales bacterium]|jgi:hypothetical protein|nr:cytochrome b561 domain-containing protein [Rhodospirillales bacterium]
MDDPGYFFVVHGLIMIACWGILVPVSVLITRFFKVMPGQNYPEVTDHKFWMQSHRAMSVTTILVLTAGAAIAWFALGGISLAPTHGKWGFAVILLGWGQLLIARMRGSHGGPWGLNNPDRIVLPRDQWFGDHYNMTRRRRIFEAVHISTGHTTAGAGLIAVWFGINQMGLAWGWQAGYGIWLLAMAGAFLKFTRDGRHVPTYHAIWGPGPEHPGNSKAPDAGSE